MFALGIDTSYGDPGRNLSLGPPSRSFVLSALTRWRKVDLFFPDPTGIFSPLSFSSCAGSEQREDRNSLVVFFLHSVI